MNIYRLASMNEVVANTDKSKPVFCDTETKGLYGNIRLLQVFQEGWDQVLIVDSPNHLEVVAYLVKVHNVWHNSHYDFTCVAPGFFPPKFDDTFLLSRLAQPQFEKYSLDEVMKRTHGFDPYEQAGLDKKVLQKSDWSKPTLTSDQLLYAAIDVYYMPEVWLDVKHKNDDPSYILDKSTLVSCLDFQTNGMPIDPDRWQLAYDKAIAALRKVPWISNDRVYTYENGKHKIVMPANPNSYVQVRKLLNVDKSDKQFLSELAVMHGDQESRNVLDARKHMKILSFLEKYNSDRIYGKFKPSARSGRLTSDDQNLQQIPRALKEIFGVKEDRVLIYSDYAQLELRTICAIIGVKVMEELFRENKDLHGYVASILFGEDYGKNDRQVTKTYNFNLLYGGSVGMVLSILITYGMHIEHRLATRHKTKWLNLFSELNKWQQECISKWRKGKLNATPLGRQYKAKLMTDFMNIMNQGAGAEVSKLALHYFKPKLKAYNEEHGTDFILCNFIHDSFITEGPNDPEHYQAVAKMKAECMQEAWFEMSKLFKIKDLPMPVDVNVGHNWGDLEEGENIIWSYTLEGMALCA